MEGRETYQESYNYLNKLENSNNGSNVLIEYGKLDTKSKGELMELISQFCRRRKREIYNNILSGVNKA